MPTAAQLLQNDLLNKIIVRYEQGAAKSKEESSVYIVASKGLRDQRLQTKAFRDSLKEYAEVQGSIAELNESGQSTQDDTTSVVGDIVNATRNKSTDQGVTKNQSKKSSAASSAIDRLEQSSNLLDNLVDRVDDKMHSIGNKIDDYIDDILSQSTKSQNIHGSVFGTEVKNTWITMAKSGDVGDAIKTLIADCIPCAGRVTSGFQLDILGNFKANIESDIQNRLKYLKNMFDFTTNKEAYNDLCTLISALNFMCVPDLIRIISLLNYMLMKLSLNLADLFNVLLGLVSALFKPFLIDFSVLLDQYAQIVLNVIECILDSFGETMAKLGIDTSGVEEVRAAANEKVGKITDVESVSVGTEKIGAAVGSGLLMLTETLRDGKDSLNGQIEELQKQLNSLLGQGISEGMHGIDFATSKLRIIRLLSLVELILSLKSEGIDCSGQQNLSAEQISFFVNSVNSDTYSISVDTKGNSIIITDNQPTLVNKAAEILGGIGIVDYSTVGQPIPDVSDTSISSQAVGNTLTSLNVSLEDCLYGSEAATSDKVKEWMNELNLEINA